ncbi:MAG: 4Fe-4S dicluster domain-containing protein [Candidatus Bathyarchaeia archaeon]
MEDEIMRLAHQWNLNFCIQCGRCSSSCPMRSIYHEYTKDMAPRRIVQKVLLNQGTSLEVDIWYCLTCRLCAIRCNQGVRFREFIKGLREIFIGHHIINMGHICRHCRRYLIPSPAMAFIHRRLSKDMDMELIDSCPSCRRRLHGERQKPFSRKGRIPLPRTGATK